VIARTVFDASGNPTILVNDRLHPRYLSYDDLNRLETEQDVVGNTILYGYDKNGNRIRMEEGENEPGGGTFVTHFFFDKFDRLKATINNANETTRYMFDSRGNQVFTSDAVNPTNVPVDPLDTYDEYGMDGTLVNGHGNTTIQTFDDVCRWTQSDRYLRVNGLGGQPVDSGQAGNGKITLKCEYDKDSRLTKQRDDKDNPTTYTYDVLNRLTATTYADGESDGQTYYRDDLVFQRFAANHSIAANTYDPGHRLSHRTIGNVVGGTTSEDYAYDGADRMLSAANTNPDPNPDLVTTVYFGYDTMSHVLSETRDNKQTTTIYDGVGNLTNCTYPGLRAVQNGYDFLERLQTVQDQSGNIATYAYAGPSRVHTRSYSNLAQLAVSYDAVRRVNGMTTLRSGSPIDDRSFQWDRASNKTQRKDITNPAAVLTHDYTYDSQYRMMSSNRTRPGTTAQLVSYGLDGVGNRGTVSGGPDAGTYAMAAGGTAEDAEVNQYTSTPTDNRGYDDAGNLTGLVGVPSGSPTVALKFDYRNRLIEYRDTSTVPATVHTYFYDALGRRTSRLWMYSAPARKQATTTIRMPGSLRSTTAPTTLTATYVYGRGLDAVLTMQRGGVDYFYHTDDLGNVMKITAANGSVVESNEYGDYGRPLDPGTFQPKTTSGIGNPCFFTGARLDFETGFYYMRARYMDPKSGRFVSRDPIGMWGDLANLGNGASYAGNNPWSTTDPTGMKRCETEEEKQARRRARREGLRRELERMRQDGRIKGDTSYWKSSDHGWEFGYNPFEPPKYTPPLASVTTTESTYSSVNGPGNTSLGSGGIRNPENNNGLAKVLADGSGFDMSLCEQIKRPCFQSVLEISIRLVGKCDPC
jgi:RHS repeat-associated protein